MQGQKYLTRHFWINAIHVFVVSIRFNKSGVVFGQETSLTQHRQHFKDATFFSKCFSGVKLKCRHWGGRRRGCRMGVREELYLNVFELSSYMVYLRNCRDRAVNQNSNMS